MTFRRGVRRHPPIGSRRAIRPAMAATSGAESVCSGRRSHRQRAGVEIPAQGGCHTPCLGWLASGFPLVDRWSGREGLGDGGSWCRRGDRRVVGGRSWRRATGLVWRGSVKLAQRVRGWVDAVDVAIARRSRELAAEGRSESAAEVLTGYGRRSTRETKAASDRSEVCEQMPGFETALADGAVSAGHVDAVANAAKGLDDAGRERLGGLAGRVCWASPGWNRSAVFERRCRLLGKRLAGDEGESRAGQTESGGVGATLGRQTVRDAPHPPRLGSRA